jgi:thymidylate synthase (FAD)
MDKFRVEVIAATSNPQQLVWAAMHQDYSEDFVWDKKDKFPDEAKAGELIVKHLLAGNRGHYGCIEHPQITFNAGYFPHSMMQQIRTHRVGVSFDVQCLAGDTEITFVKTCGHLKKIKISQLYKLWTNKTRNLQKTRLRVLNEATNTFETSNIKDVMCSGIQPVYRLTLEDGKKLDCTTNHQLLTSLGWQRMEEAVGLVTASDNSVVTTLKECFVLCNGLTVAGNSLYRDRQWLQEQIQQEKTIKEIAQLAQCSDTTIRDWMSKYKLKSYLKNTKFRKGEKPGNYNQNALLNWESKPKLPGHKLKAHPVKIAKVEYLGLQATYDLEVNAPWHNFVANGIVVHNSFRYTGSRIIDVVEGKRDLEEVFYLRPVGNYTNRQGKHYLYSEEQRKQDLQWCLKACQLYQQRINEGCSEEHARSLIPFDARQHFVMSCNARSLMHLLDLRWKKDAQLEAQKLCELLYLCFDEWMPALAQWYRENRAQKARLSP